VNCEDKACVLIEFSFFQDMVQKPQAAVNCAVTADKFGSIVIRIQAKPGAKQNAVTGLSLQNRFCTHSLLVYGAIQGRAFETSC
jgi:hypothetical protein